MSFFCSICGLLAYVCLFSIAGLFPQASPKGDAHDCPLCSSFNDVSNGDPKYLTVCSNQPPRILSLVESLIQPKHLSTFLTFKNGFSVTENKIPWDLEKIPHRHWKMCPPHGMKLFSSPLGDWKFSIP